MSRPTPAGGYSAEELVRLNSHELTAHLLVSERDARRDAELRHSEEIARLRSTLEDAQRIGLAVMRAAHAGRRMVRVTDVIGGPR